MSHVKAIISLPFHFVSGAGRVISSGKLITLFIIQLVIALLSYGLLTYFSFQYRDTLTGLFTGEITTWWEQALSWLIFIISLVVNALLAYIVMMLLGGFIMESFVQGLMRQVSLPVDEELSARSIGRVIVRTTKVTVIRLMAGALVLGMMAVAVFVPPLWLVVSLATAFLIGVDLIELPISLLEPEARAKLAVLKNHKVPILVFGALSSLVLAVPIIGLILVPILYATAVTYVAQLYRSEGA